MLFSTSRSANQIKPFCLNGDELPWVDSARHLGNYLSTKINNATKSPDTRTDLLQKRGILFDSVHQIQQQFGSHNPDLVMNLIGTYSTSLFGSALWELNSPEFQKLTRSWNTITKMVWKLPHATHKQFLESLCPIPHLGSILEGRYLGFLESLDQSSKPFLRLLFNSCKYDLSSVTGQNLNLLMTTHQKQGYPELLHDRNILKSRRRYELSGNEMWKIRMIRDLSLFKGGHIALEFDEDEATQILDYICTS